MKYKRKLSSLIKPLSALVISVCWINAMVFAQAYKSEETAIANGSASLTGGSFKTEAIIGQPFVTESSQGAFLTYPGFMSYFTAPQLFDVSIDNFRIEPTTVAANNDIAIILDIISNESGSIKANDLTIEVYLSIDPVPDEGESIGTLLVVNPVFGKTTYSFPGTGDDNVVKIPQSTVPDSYYIIVELDEPGNIPETDETNNVDNANITISDDTTDPVIQNVVNDTYFIAGSKATVSVNDNIGVDRVNSYHRGIRSSESTNWNGPISADEVSGVWSVELQAAWLDELGVEFWFEAFDAASNRDTSEVRHTFYQTLGNELTFPSIPAGREQSNYRIVAIPFDLTQKGATSIFQNFGTYNPTKWRMYHYLNGKTTEYDDGWTRLDPGKGYWLIHDVANAGQVLIGAGEALRGSKDAPYSIQLIQGWNQIGNPYRFDVNWNDVLAANGNPSEVERFRVWSNGSFADGSSLDAFSGGFVFTTTPTSLVIPVTALGGGRLADNEEDLSPLDNSEWQVLFDLNNSDLNFGIGGVGMHPQASDAKDFYDDVAMPRLPEFIDMNFDHPEYFIPRFNKDIVDTRNTHTWHFTVAKNSSDPQVRIRWDNSYFGENDKAIYLVDQHRNHVINMREQTEYSFTMEAEYPFKVIFGDEFGIEELLIPEELALGQNYPNPFSDESTIPISLPERQDAYQVKLVVLNNLGQEIKEIYAGELSPGYHQVEWNAIEETGERIESGLYIYRLQVLTGNDVITLSRQCIIE